MSEYAEVPSECQRVHDDLTLVALGILSGRSRSMVLEHVANCERCSGELEQLSIVADTVVQLAPELEPPLGFESRLADRLRENGLVGQSIFERQRSSGSFRRIAMATAAAILVLALGVGVGAFANSRGTNVGGRVGGANIDSASLTSQGHVLGEFLVSAGKPSWMFMTVDSGAWTGTVKCQVLLVGGKVETVGAFKLSGGYGSWGAPLTTSAAQVRGARLVSADGVVFASAKLPV